MQNDTQTTRVRVLFFSFVPLVDPGAGYDRFGFRVVGMLVFRMFAMLPEIRTGDGRYPRRPELRPLEIPQPVDRHGTRSRFRNHNTGKDFWSDTEFRVAHQMLFHDTVRPSRLVLPILQR